MKHVSISPAYIFLLSCMLFDSSYVFSADENSADVESSVRHNQQELYVCFDKNASEISRLVFEISELDSDTNSPIHLLKRHLEEGYLLGLHDEVVAVLEYADWFVGNLQEKDMKHSLSQRLNNVFDQVLKGNISMTEEAVNRAPHLKLTTFGGRLSVVGKAFFKNNVIIDKKLRVHGKARFYDAVDFKDGISLEGTITADGSTFGRDVSVNGNINLNSSTSAMQGNINKGMSSFIHNFGMENTFVGVNAGNFSMTGFTNTGLGTRALQSNATGSQNTAVGVVALQNNTQGLQNVAVGAAALQSNVTGNNNVAVGFEAGIASVGTDNTFVGSGAGSALTSGDNNLYLGSEAGFAGAESDTTRIGATQKRAFVAGVSGVAVAGSSVVVNASGQLGVVGSSKRFKHDIEKMQHESTRIYDLNPVKFVYNQDTRETQQYGLIAEEVKEVFPELVINEQDGTPFTVRYEVLPILLLNEMQKQNNKVNSLSALVDDCLRRIAMLEE